MSGRTMAECARCVPRQCGFDWLVLLFWLRRKPRLQARPAPQATHTAGISPWRMWDNESFVPLPGCSWPRSAFPLEPSSLAQCPSCLEPFSDAEARERVGLRALPAPLSPPLSPRAPVQAPRQPGPRHKTSFTLLHLAGKASSWRPEEARCPVERVPAEFYEKT